MIRRITGILLLVLSNPAVAAVWVDVTASTTGAIWYVDVSSIKDVTEGYGNKVRKVWLRIDYKNDKTQLAREAKALVVFKCVEEQVKVLNWVLYKGDGTVLKDVSPSYATYDAVVPESVMSGVMNPVCAYRVEGQM